MTNGLQQHDERLLAGLSRMEKAVLWTGGYLDKLERAGWIELPGISLEPKGAEVFEALCRSGYEPCEQAVRASIRAFALKVSGKEPEVGLVDKIVVLIQEKKGASK